MEIHPSHEGEARELRRLYHRLHPDINAREFESQVRHESQGFTATDERDEVVGLALVSYLDYGLYPYGLIHELEGIDSSPQIRASLVDACVDWLRERGAPIVYVSATSERERALYRNLGFDAETTEMYRSIPPRAARQVWA